MKKWLLVLAFLISFAHAAPPKQQIILTQKNAPVVLDNLVWYYVNNSRERGLSASINYKNTTNQEITALSVCFIFYGAFNNELAMRCGLNMFTTTDGNLKPNSKGGGEWMFTYTGDWQTTTVLAFASRARTLDNKIWQSDTKEIQEQILKLLGASFDPSKIPNP